MYAVRVHETGDEDVLKYEGKVDIPVPGESDVLVDVHATGVNYIDTYHRTGLYAMPLPFVPGREGAGVVRAVGSKVTAFAVGDRVAFGSAESYAQVVKVSEARVVKVPPGLSLKVAAAAMLQGLTAHYLSHSTFKIRPGHTVLVHAAAGGTGGLLVQMAKLRGATVIATVGTDAKADEARRLGADHTIVYTREDFEAEVKRITDGEGVHCVYDGVGAATWEKSLASVRRCGYLVLFGNASGAVPPINPLRLTKAGSVFLARPSLVDHIATREVFQERAGDLLSWITESKLEVRIAKEFPLAEAAESHRYLASRAALGKVLLVVDQP